MPRGFQQIKTIPPLLILQNNNHKTAWKSSFTLFINTPLADGDSSLIRNIRWQILCRPHPFKDTESDTSAVALFEVMTDSGFYCTECISKEFLTWFLMCHQLLLFVVGNRYFLSHLPLLFSLFFTLQRTNWHFCFFCEIFLSRLQLEWVVNGSIYLRRIEMKWWITILRHDRRLTPSGGQKPVEEKTCVKCLWLCGCVWVCVGHVIFLCSISIIQFNLFINSIYFLYCFSLFI